MNQTFLLLIIGGLALWYFTKGTASAATSGTGTGTSQTSGPRPLPAVTVPPVSSTPAITTGTQAIQQTPPITAVATQPNAHPLAIQPQTGLPYMSLADMYSNLVRIFGASTLRSPANWGDALVTVGLPSQSPNAAAIMGSGDSTPITLAEYWSHFVTYAQANLGLASVGVGWV